MCGKLCLNIFLLYTIKGVGLQMMSLISEGVVGETDVLRQIL